MKKFKLILLLVIATFCSLSLSSCSDDDDDDNTPIEDPCGLKDEEAAFEKAVEAYYANQSKANCLAYKQATTIYLQEARKCTLLDEETRQGLEEALISVTSGLNCDN